VCFWPPASIYKWRSHRNYQSRLNQRQTDAQLSAHETGQRRERRIDNERLNIPHRGRAGLERAQRELSVIEAQLRLRGSLSDDLIELSRHPGERCEQASLGHLGISARIRSNGP
jgi:hypothetical protein